MFMQISPDLRKKPVDDQPSRNTVFVPYYPDALPEMPEYGCGATFNIPENLYRPLPELRKVFRMIAASGSDDDFSIVDGWFAYEIDSRTYSAAAYMSEAEREALSGKRADAKRSAAAAKREKKELERLESRLSLWHKITGRENPDNDATQETTHETETAAAVKTETTQETETKMEK